MTPAPDHQAVAQAALSLPWADFWSRRERAFLESMTRWRTCSGKQRNWLDRLATRAKAARAADRW